MSDKILGIDLGTTNSLVGVVDSGFPILFADGKGSRLTPSVVHFARGGEILVGEKARRMKVMSPELTVSSVKRKMGEGTELIVGDEKMSPEEVSAHILIYLKNWIILQMLIGMGINQEVTCQDVNCHLIQQEN